MNIDDDAGWTELEESNFRYIITPNEHLILDIDLRKNLGLSAKKKSILVSTTAGSLNLRKGDIQLRDKINFNIYRPKPRPDQR